MDLVRLRVRIQKDYIPIKIGKKGGRGHGREDREKEWEMCVMEKR